jgi:hypothetical protein
MRSLPAVLVACFATTVLAVAPASADSATVVGGVFTVRSTNVADDTCVDIPITYDMTSMPVDWSWSLELASTSAYGAYMFGSGGDTGVDEAMWCPADVVGAFALTGILEVRDANYESVASDLVQLSFTVSKRTTKATLRATDKTPKAKKVFRLKGCVSAAGKREDYRTMQIQTRKPGGSWKKLTTTYTDSVGCYSELAYISKPGTRYIRTYVPATYSRSKAYSPVLKMRAHK